MPHWYYKNNLKPYEIHNARRLEHLPCTLKFYHCQVVTSLIIQDKVIKS